MELEAERQHLEKAAGLILDCYNSGEIDLDDIIEELRPVRMRLHALSCQLVDQTVHSTGNREAQMNERGFRKFLAQREIPEEEIEASIVLARKFEAHVNTVSQPPPGKEDVVTLSDRMIEEGINTLPNFYALARYGRFIMNDEIYVAVVDLLDGGEAMGKLQHRVGEVWGDVKRDEVFDGIDVPPMGTPNQEKVVLNQQVMTRLEDVASPEECDQIFADSLRDLEDVWFQDDVKLFEECKDIDEFLDKSAQNFIDQLEKLRDDGELFFTQEITDKVVEYVRSEPLVARGIREGNILYEVKIPHQTREFLAETYAQKKRYYYCHCPWVKESLKNGASEIPVRFCDCSAGFHKKRWEVIFDQPLRAEIVESVLQGDDWCKIAIHLPDGIT